MKAALFWLCLFVATLASIEGGTLKKPKPVKYNFKSSNRIETQQRNEKWKKVSSNEKNIRCFIVDNTRTVRCSLVQKCPNDDPSCSTIRQVRQTLESASHEDKIQKASTTRKAIRSKCSDTTNPLCIHDIWVGKRSDQNPLPKKEHILTTTLCSADNEMCLLTIKRAEESSRTSLEYDKDEVTTDPEETIRNGRNLSPSSSTSRPDCDFIRDPNCKLEGSPGKHPASEDVLKRLKVSLPIIKRQKNCKNKLNSKICRWRPQPNDVDEDQKSSSSSSSSSKDSESNTVNTQTR